MKSLGLALTGAEDTLAVSLSMERWLKVKPITPVLESHQLWELQSSLAQLSPQPLMP